MMREHIARLLQDVKSGRRTVRDALADLQALPYKDIGVATLDTHRAIRLGFPEVVYGQEKTADQIARIVAHMKKNRSTVLVTRVDASKGRSVSRRVPGVRYHAPSGTLIWQSGRAPRRGTGRILVASAGTSDLHVAEEARVTAEVMGNDVETLYDVGVAGIHRVLLQRDTLLAARVIIVVAGMEGALASVIGGLVARPIIAVPTSVGYGSSFHGLSALLAMLNSCAPGVTVVNIDNGFGAAVAASMIIHQ